MKQINPYTFSRRLRQSFATGAASIISVPGNYLPISGPATDPWRRDREAIAGDWARVGSYFSATTRAALSTRCIKH